MEYFQKYKISFLKFLFFNFSGCRFSFFGVVDLKNEKQLFGLFLILTKFYKYARYV